MASYESTYTGGAEVLKNGWNGWGQKHQLVVLKQERFAGPGGAKKMEGKCQAAPFFLLEGGKQYTHFRGNGWKCYWVAHDGQLAEEDVYFTLTNNRCEMPKGESGAVLHHRTMQGIK